MTEYDTTPEYDCTLTYAKGDEVIFLGEKYQSNHDGLVNIEPTREEIAIPVTPFAEWVIKPWRKL